VERKIARIVFLGTVTDEALREERRDNLAVATQIASEPFAVLYRISPAAASGYWK